MVQRLVLLTLVLSLTLLWGATGLTAPEPPEAMPGATPSASKPTMLALERAYGEMPLYFIENCGQLDGQVAYYLPGSDKTLYFTAEGVTFALTGRRQTVDSRQGEEDPFLPADFSPSPDLPFSPSLSRWAVKLDFVDANPAVQPVGESSLEMVVSYFKGKPEDWHTGLRTYSRLVYRDLWPGIDLVYYGTVNQLKYEFVVHPGADPAQIRLAYRGASDVRLNAVGQLEVTTPVGSFTDDTPVAYQEIGGQRVPVKMSYELPMTDEVNPVTNSPFSFAIGDYDATRPLILDPAILLYSGFIGGNGEEQAYDIAVDNTGNAYVVGFTGSSNFPTIEGPDLIFNGGTYDVFIAKIRADGAGLVYAGFLGGTGDEEGSGVAVDNLGNAYITGYTGSTDFPVLNGPDLSFNGGTYDVFIAKINTTGTALIYSGFLGGSDSDYGLDIILDEANAVYITGRTASSNFPTVIGPDLSFNGTYDAFVTKVNAAGDSLVYSGFVGGNNDERSYSIAIDDAQNVYITGWTKSDDFPTTNGFDQVYNGLEDAFVVKVDNDGTTLAYASFLGSGGDDRGYGVAVDDAGYAYVTGYTNSPGFPTISGGMDTTHNGNYDAFVAKVHPNGSNLSYASFLGGSGNDYAYNIAIDTQGNSYVTGYTASTNFPTIGGLDATHNGGIEDVFVVKVNETGTALAYAGYIGGSSAERGTDIAIDVIGNAYVTGYTQSSDFSVVGGPDLSYNDNSDAFVAKISAIHTVSGSVVDASGDGIANVLLTTSANDSTLTDAYGYYTFTTIYSGTHVMTPTLTGIFFTPRTRTVVVTECNVSDVNFTGHFVPHSVSLGGVANGATTVAYRFTATTNPTATTPITYTWQATGQTNQTVVNGTSASAVFTWTTTGVKTVTVNAYNAGGEVTATHTITLHVPFEDGSVSITPIVNSAVAWGDYNQDHALDAVTVGYYDGTSPFARLYRNTGGGLSDSGNALTGLGFSAVAWGDYDNDNEVDLLVTGANGSSQPFTQLYHNEDGVLTEAMTLTGVYKGSAAWGDYDNDGDLDILLTGQTGSGTRIARVYRNDAGVFNDSGAALTGVYESSAAWGDYDNDGDLDILLTGADNSGNRATRLYRNGDGVFTSVSTALPDMAFSSVAWGDYDQDGDLDILMAGYIGGGGPGRVTRIYRNDGNAVFTNINAALSGVEPDAPQAVAWGDYDNDGDLDIVLTGYNQSDQVTVLIYRNDGNGQFTDIGAALTGVWYASVAWGDYDADGDLDLLLTGYDAYGGVGKLYRNNSNVPNTAPTAPQGLQAAPGISTTQFSWQAVQDSETLSPTLTYNLRVGTTPGGSDIVAPMALITDGYRLLPAFGNVQHGLTATLALTQPGVYSWAVQAVDTAFAGGAWSAEQTLRVGAPLTIALKGQRVGLRNQTYPLTATINLTAALPITYVWQTSAHTPVTHTAIFSYTDAVSFAWTTEGVHSITVTAINIAGDLTATQRITITTPPQAVTFSPPRHIVTASPTTTISVTYNQLMDLTSVTSRTFAIHGMQSGLVTGTHYLINGNTLGVTPPRPFHQGELIYAVATTHTRSITGVVPLTATAWQFNAGVVAPRRVGNFTAISSATPLTPVYRSAVAWGDYDRDGDLDILLTGKGIAPNHITALYRNEWVQGSPDTFTLLGLGLPGVYRGAVAWGDGDGDGDLDLLLAGLNDTTPIAEVYRNEAGALVASAAGLTGVSDGAAAWSDYDNDGDLDILLTGHDGVTRTATLYRNDVGVYNPIAANLTGVDLSAAAWGDYDNDGDLDLLITGRDKNEAHVAHLYRNETAQGAPGDFTPIVTGLTGVESGSVAWGDYDNDGDLDLLLTGLSASITTRVYRNDAGDFTLIASGLTAVRNGAAVWGDYDNDGDLDILLTGNTSVEQVTQVYRNDDGVFTLHPNTMPGVSGSAVAWGDYDNDNDLDILLTGSDAGVYVATVYRNEDYIAPQNVVLTGASTGQLYTTYPLTATITPLTTTLPLTYVWQSAGAPITRSVFGLTDTQPFSWTTPGVYPITVTAGNALGWVTATHTITLTLFGNTQADLQGVNTGAVAWGDYDNDGDLDLLLSGRYTDGGNYYITRLYRNDASVFADSGVTLPGVNASAVAWGDYDNDNDLDMLLSGWTGMTRIARIYRNTGGTFDDSGAALPTATDGSAAWGDYDNDGDLDILLTGAYMAGSVQYVAAVYRNEGGVFTDSGIALPGVRYGVGSWGDYDNDGDLDILLSGYYDDGTPHYIARIYRNDNGNFVNIAAGLTGVAGSAQDWGDYDSDGDLDILLMGYYDDGNGHYLTRVYRNDDGVFADSGVTLPGVRDGTATWGDFDNDGALDILLTGETDGGYVTQVYRNTGSGFSAVDAGLPLCASSAAAWGDYDNDADLDILLTGHCYEGSFQDLARVYRNSLLEANTSPTLPDNLYATFSDQVVTLSWAAGSDAQTTPAALTYNLRVGTTPGGSEIIAPMALADGYRQIPALGNAQHGLTTTLAGLAPGDYYWSVQAIDTTFAGSVWAAESSFTTIIPTYTLKVAVVGHGAVTQTPSQTTYLLGTIVTLTAIPDTDWYFGQWSGDASGILTQTTITLDADKTVTATFLAFPPTYYTLTMGLVGSGVITPAIGAHSYLFGALVDLSAAPNPGWQFVGWSGDMVSTASPTMLTIDESKEVTATFTLNSVSHTLTLAATGDGHGTVTPAVGVHTYLSGTTVFVTATAQAGSEFTGWQGATTGLLNPATILMDGDQVLTATFRALSHTLAVAIMGQGTVTRTPSQTTYLYGEVVTLTATPDSGWYFGQWSGDVSGILTQTLLTMDANHTVTATFVATPPTYYTLTMALIGSGIITPDVGTHSYLAGTVVELDASPTAGWEFTGWSGDLNSLEKPTTIMLSADKMVTATFILPACPHPVSSVSINGPTNGYTDTEYVFTGVIAPTNATLPITYTWLSHEISVGHNAALPYAWQTSGGYTLTLRAENCGGAVSATHTIAVYTHTAPVAPLEVILIGPTSGLVNVPYEFQAMVNPTATLPLTYTWSASRHPLIQNDSRLTHTDTAAFTWNVYGPQAITITVANAQGIVTGTFNLVVTPGASGLQVAKSVIPASTVYPGSILTYTLTFSNTGSQTLTNLRLQDRLPGDTTYLGGSLSDGGTYDLVAHTINWGGDLFPKTTNGPGYTLSPVAYQWTEIAATGNVIFDTDWQGNGDSGWFGPIPLGFDFPYFQDTQVYTQAYITTNGYIGFGPPTNYEDVPESLPELATPNNIIVPYGDNLYIKPGDSRVFYQQLANPARLVVEYQSAQDKTSGGVFYTFQVILYATGEIRFVYSGGAAASFIGLEDATGVRGLLYSTPVFGNNRTLHFTPREFRRFNYVLQVHAEVFNDGWLTNTVSLENAQGILSVDRANWLKVPPDSYEPNATCNTAHPLTPTTMLTSYLSRADDVDTYRLTLPLSYTMIAITLTSPVDAEAIVSLFDGECTADGTPRHRDTPWSWDTPRHRDTGPGAIQTILYNTGLYTGIYHIQIAGIGGQWSTAPYTVEIASWQGAPFPGLDDGDSCAASTWITPGVTISNTLMAVTDKDHYAFAVLEPHTQIAITLTSVFSYNLDLYDGCIETTPRHRDTPLDWGIDLNQNVKTIVYNVGPYTGTYYVQVYGFDNAYNADNPYWLEVTLSVTREPGVKTLILYNPTRLRQLYGNTATEATRAALQQLANHSAVGGRLVTLNEDPTVNVAYAAWDADPTNPARANDVSTAIKTMLLATLGGYPDLNYMVIVGNDRIIPFRRVPDETGLWEHSYVGFGNVAANSTTGAALAADYFLSDDFYADRSASWWDIGKRDLYIPDFAVGRLVETPIEITTFIDAFLTNPQTSLNRSFVAGHVGTQPYDDFLVDVSMQAAARLRTHGGGTLVTLIGPQWTAPDLRQVWLQQRADLAVLNLHANHWGLSTSRDPSGIENSDILSATAPLTRAVYTTLGCHAGLNIPDQDNNAHTTLDLAQTFARRGVNWIANTGYGIGGDATPYSEQLTLFVNEELTQGSQQTLGAAWARAKQRYYLSIPETAFGYLDEKVMGELVFYGLPMYTLNTALPRTQSQDSPMSSIAVSPWSRTGESLLQQRRDYAPELRAISVITWGTYFEAINTDLVAGTYAQQDHSIQPRLLDPVSTTVRGVVFESGVYTTTVDFDPLVTRLGHSDAISTTEAVLSGAGWWPAQIAMVRELETLAGIQRNLILVPGQYRPADAQQRVYQQVSISLYASSLPDQTPPAITSVQQTIGEPANAITVTVTASDNTGIQRVLLTYTTIDHQGIGHWASLNLTPGVNGIWQGQLAGLGALEYFIQVVDTAGNVTLANNDGRYYTLTLSSSPQIYLPLVLRSQTTR